jgi:hypothetical protein
VVSPCAFQLMHVSVDCVLEGRLCWRCLLARLLVTQFHRTHIDTSSKALTRSYT